MALYFLSPAASRATVLKEDKFIMKNGDVLNVLVKTYK